MQELNLQTLIYQFLSQKCKKIATLVILCNLVLSKSFPRAKEKFLGFWEGCGDGTVTKPNTQRKKAFGYVD